MKIQYLLIGLFSVLVSCQAVRFEELQPKGGKDLKEFPIELQGIYLMQENMQSDTASAPMDTLRISKNAYWYPQSYVKSVTRLELEGNTEYRLEGNKIWMNTDTGFVAFDYTIANDTVNIQVKSIEIVYLGDKLKLRKYKKDYFLNFFDENAWEVVYLEQENPGVWRSYFFIVNSEDAGEKMEKYRRIAPLNEVKTDDDGVSHYTANPSRRQLYKWIDAGLAKPHLTLKRIN